MKLYRLDSTPPEPVSHNPEIMKRVLVKGGLSCVRHLSHIVLSPGDTAAAHSHPDAYEVFYCVRGEAEFVAGGRAATLTSGSCLVVEPGEEHSIRPVREQAELVYMLVSG